MTRQLLFVLMLVPATASAQATDALASYRSARSTIEASLRALGGDEFDKAPGFTIRIKGTDHARLQSRTPALRNDTFDYAQTLVYDRAGNRMAFEDARRLPGFFWSQRRVIDGTRASFSLDMDQRTFVDKLPILSAEQRADRLARVFPQQLLENVLRRNPETLRSLGVRNVGGKPYDVVSFAANGTTTNIYFDPATHLLHSTESVYEDDMAGDAVNERVVVSYRNVGSVRVPARIIERQAGEVLTDYTYDIELAPVFPDGWLSIPSDFAALPPFVRDTAAVRKIADDVYLIQVGYNVLAVGFDDYVLAMEAPSGMSERAVTLIQQTFPNKPIRYVAVTHHHNDHAGGVRSFMGRGVTLVTTPGNEAFFKGVAAAPYTIQPDVQQQSKTPAKIELVRGKRVFQDAHHVVELYDIGPSPHTKEMLVAYLPKEKFLFQGDLLNLSGSGFVPAANATTRHFARKLRELGLDVQSMAGVHAPPHGMKELDEAIAKARARGVSDQAEAQ